MRGLNWAPFEMPCGTTGTVCENYRQSRKGSSSPPTNPANAAKPESISGIFAADGLSIWRSMLTWGKLKMWHPPVLHINQMGINSAAQRSAKHEMHSL
jgi:hypothetical protein